jgi:hypothetical protein
MLSFCANSGFRITTSLGWVASLRICTYLIFSLVSCLAVLNAQDGHVSQRIELAETRSDSVVLIPWAIGTPDNIVNLRQPRGYTSLLTGMFGATLGPDYRDKTLKDRKSATDFLFSALLPDMKPWTRETLPEFKKRGGGAVVEGLVTSIVFATKAPTEEAYLRILFDVERNALLHDSQLRPPGVVIGEKPARFGLRRIGPLNLPQNRSPYYLPQDMYFLGDNPEASPIFIVCQAEELPTREKDQGAKTFAQCKHFMMFKALSAVVRLNYRREYIKDWHEIQTKAERLLASFIP